MAPDKPDRPHETIGLRDAYEAIRRWYTENVHMLDESDGYARRSAGLIRAMRPASDVSDIEIRAVLGEVIYGNLEWGYTRSDGTRTMADYAKAALSQAGLTYGLSVEDLQSLQASSLWEHLSVNREPG